MLTLQRVREIVGAEFAGVKVSFSSDGVMNFHRDEQFLEVAPGNGYSFNEDGIVEFVDDFYDMIHADLYREFPSY